ncbi:hypothetical protein BJ878DRAFT_122109 [Calycina marina]|uniref:Ribosomal lysine N-methyltransferase 4 n=1 Tax=Calycina marina TaxID=1763456 RepID=A0A9P8CIH9_9HELO|nr:hypothetical protein BJ878DRAFT_122109 [Calycina marina]
MAQDSFHETTSDFLSWLQEKGVQLSPNIAVHDFRQEGRGRGVIAIADIQEDEVLFSIPRSAVLNLNNTISALPTEAMQETISAMPSWLALTTLMMIESLRGDSNWASYLTILPEKLDSLIFWNTEDLAHLQASTVVQKIGRDKAGEMFAQYVAPLGLANYDTGLLHRVASIIMAYAFDIPEEKPNDGANETTSANGEDEDDDLVLDNGDDEKTILSMIPLADMLNADADRNNARLCCDHEDLEMRSIKPITSGEEIFNDYGQLPRSDLLRRYGFITEQYAPYDVAEISTESIKSAFETGFSLSNGSCVEPLSKLEVESRCDLADREGFLEDSYDLAHPSPDGLSIPDELVALVYLLLLNDENLDSIKNGNPISSRSKIATELVGQLLTQLLQRRAVEYGTTIEDDKITLQQATLSDRAQKAIQVRLGEKKVLKGAIDEANTFAASNKRLRGNATSQEPAANKKRKPPIKFQTMKKNRTT